MIEKIFVFWLLITMLPLSNATSFVKTSQPVIMYKTLHHFLTVEKINTNVNPMLLPIPYSYLLTQPLMTVGIKTYYQRTPFINILYAVENPHDHTYSRVITMHIDSKASRNNTRLAIKNNETVVVELAFITINLKVLPEKIITDIRRSDRPFGQLLSDNHLLVETKNRTYFSVKCSLMLASLLQCPFNQTIYGRTHTIINTNNNIWLANVTEILPGFVH